MGKVSSLPFLVRVVEREDGGEGRHAVFFLDGARIVRRAKAEFQLVHGVLLVMSAR